MSSFPFLASHLKPPLHAFLPLRSGHDHVAVWSGVIMETLATEKHQHHALYQPRLPEDHRGRDANLQEL